MSNSSRWLWVLILGLGAPLFARGQTRAMDVRVDPRVELLTIAARLAGFAEFNRDNSKSPYSEDVERQFGALREHAAIRTLGQLRAERGVSFDAIASFAVHLGPLPELRERIAFDALPERLDPRWGVEGARRFAEQLRQFAKEAKAEEFFARHHELYAEVERRLSARVGPSPAIAWFDTFFGVRQGAKYTAIAGLLCGGQNFGVGVRFRDGSPEEFLPVLGCWTFDEKGVPTFGDVYLSLLIHELCHSYTNPFVDHFENDLRKAGERIYASCAARMQAQSYSNWQSVLYETLVRASTVRCRLATEGRPAAEQQARDEVAHHFKWVPKLAGLFGEYESDRAKYPSFETFMPRVVAFLDSYAAELDEIAAKTPKLLSMEPAAGATDVDVSLETMTLRFDRAMVDQGWSIVGSKTDTPEITGTPRYDEARRVLTIPIKLEAKRTYRFSLNGERREGFKSAEGVALEPVEVTFTTRG